MIKTTVIALLTAASLAGVAAPAYASAFGDVSPEFRSFVADSIVADLNQKGVHATSVEEWGDLIRAYVTNDNGTQTMEFFTPGSLQPVTK
ncbi:hypothetical protein WH87_09180 [Devosia epidermidihirudinis]|uniref:PepSY domain-containing protein n=1 Tax=Devosia epidermidihirudinis TaxID=1293439 RepID=A0A0F5QAU0_9HYPH|nr:hypothetical protein [Devosia epidermidihirudinis]KKC37846.1 hypothetical protein WH87_09180 [Devosia epidermidihirudinis]